MDQTSFNKFSTSLARHSIYGKFSADNFDRLRERSIILNLSEDHACPNKCEYCNWKDSPLVNQRIQPNIEDVINFLDGYASWKVIISGGGDPLFNYKENEEYLRKLSRTIRKLGYKVTLITRYYYEAFLLNTIFDQICFSVDKEEPLIKKYFNNFDLLKKMVRVTVVFDGDLEKIKKLYDYYKDSCHFFMVRDDMNNSLSEKELKEIEKELKQESVNKRKIAFLPASACLENFYLVNNAVYRGSDLFTVKKKEG
jgi:organic radical activating enzyme